MPDAEVPTIASILAPIPGSGPNMRWRVASLSNKYSSNFFHPTPACITAYISSALPVLGAYVINKLLQANDNGFELLTAVLAIFVATVEEKQALKSVSVLSERVQVPNAEQSRVVQQDKPVDSGDDSPHCRWSCRQCIFFLRKVFAPTHVQPPSAEVSAYRRVGLGGQRAGEQISQACRVRHTFSTLSLTLPAPA